MVLLLLLSRSTTILLGKFFHGRGHLELNFQGCQINEEARGQTIINLGPDGARFRFFLWPEAAKSFLRWTIL